MNGTNYEVPHCGAFSTPHSHPSWAQIFASGSCFQQNSEHQYKFRISSNHIVVKYFASSLVGLHPHGIPSLCCKLRFLSQKPFPEFLHDPEDKEEFRISSNHIVVKYLASSLVVLHPYNIPSLCCKLRSSSQKPFPEVQKTSKNLESPVIT